MKRVAALFALTALVVACGGGGGGGGDAPAVPPVVSPQPSPPPPPPAPPPPPPASAQLSLLAGNMGGAGNLDGGTDVARFERPASIAVDSSGNRYVSDTANHTIRKISADGKVVSILAGRTGEAGDADGFAGEARFNEPSGLAIDSLFLYVADTGNRMVRRIRLQNGDVRTLAGNPDPASTVAVDGSSGRLGTARFADPVALALGPVPGGPLFVADKSTVRMLTLANRSVITIAGTLNTQDCASATPTVPVAANAALCRPTGLAFRSADGRLYVTDGGRHAVRAIVPGAPGFGPAPVNLIDFVAGSPNRLTGTQDGVGAEATFDFPDSITVTRDGELIVGQLAALRRIRISSEDVRVDILAGSATREVGNIDGSRAEARFGRSIPGVAIDANGDVVVADSDNHLIRSFGFGSQQVGTLAGQRASFGNDDGAAALARFAVPTGISLAADGSATLVDASAERARRIDITARQVTTLATLQLETTPVGVVAAEPGQPAVMVGEDDHSVRVIEGGEARVLAGSGATDGEGFVDGDGARARFDSPSGIARDATGVVFVADRNNHRIRAVAPDGTTSTFAGQAERGHVDGAIELARFDEPLGIAIAANDELFVLEAGNRAIRKIAKDAQGRDIVSTVTQDLLDPQGLAVDEAGNLYVIDGSEQTVRRFKPGATQGELIVGTPNQCGFVPGTLPGVICRPRGIAVRDGRLLLTMDQGVLLVEPLSQ